MVELEIGRHGVLILLILFLLLGFEDILIWVNQGIMPAIEFFLAMVLVLGVIMFALREANRHKPPNP